MKPTLFGHTLLLTCFLGLAACAAPQTAEQEAPAQEATSDDAQEVADTTKNANNEANAVDTEQNRFVAQDGTELHAQAGHATYDAGTRVLSVVLSKPVEASDGARSDTYSVEFQDIDLQPGVYTNPAEPQDGNPAYSILEIREVSPQHLVGAHYYVAGERPEASNTTLLGMLGAPPADGSSLEDSLSEGAANVDMDAAFASSVGVKGKHEQSGLRSAGSSGSDSTTGGIDDLGEPKESADKDAKAPKLVLRPSDRMASFSLNSLVIIPAENDDKAE